jgi:hypothetical protein
MNHRSHLAAGFREYLIMREPLGRWFDFDSEDRDESQHTSSENRADRDLGRTMIQWIMSAGTATRSCSMPRSAKFMGY